MSSYDECAHLYDIAFSWDIGEEVDWLLSRLGRGVRTILEPACGSGRMFPAFVERGVDVAGVEISATMIRRARERMIALGLPLPQILQADMANFELGATFDGAVCSINSFGYLLTSDAAGSHLDCIAQHLAAGGKYLVQVDLTDYCSLPVSTPETGVWEMERNGVTVRTQWYGRYFDPETRLETQVCRFEVLSGPDVGLVAEDEHILRRWNWAEWTGLIDESPFVLAGCYDGNSNTRDPLPVDRSLENQDLIWHELIRS